MLHAREILTEKGEVMSLAAAQQPASLGSHCGECRVLELLASEGGLASYFPFGKAQPVRGGSERSLDLLVNLCATFSL